MLRELTAARGMAVNVWLVLLHNTRLGHGASGRGGAQRLRRPLLLQPLPLGAGGARLCRRARAGRDRELSGRRHLARGAGLHALRARLPPRVRADEARTRGSRTSSGSASATTASRRPKRAGIDARRLKAQTAADITAYLDSDIDYPARHGGGVLAGRRRGRRRPAALSRFPQRRRDLAGRRNPRRGPRGRRRWR